MTSRTKFAVRTLPMLAATVLFAVSGQTCAQEPAVVGDPKAALAKISMCVGCHGIKEYKVAFPEVVRVPKIAGQNAEYIVAALQEYASGARSFPTMQAIAQGLSAQDMADLAAYYSSLK